MTPDLDFVQLIGEFAEPAETRTVVDERFVLPAWSSNPWMGRHVPRGVMVPFRGRANTAAPDAIDLQSVRLTDHRSPGHGEGQTGNHDLVAGADFVIDPTYGTICLPAGHEFKNRRVMMSYRYSLPRLDCITIAASGQLDLVAGVSHLTAPRPPAVASDRRAVAHVFMPAFGGVADAAVWPIGDELEVTLPPLQTTAPPASQGGRRLLFLGDSVTEGGEASTDSDSFRTVALRHLASRMPGAVGNVDVVAVGGSSSSDWLGSDSRCDWTRVAESGADLAIVEFVNDAELDPHAWEDNYGELLARFRRQGCEVLLMTPPFTMPTRMVDPQMTGLDRRPYTRFLRSFADRHHLPLIDVSAAWEQLGRAGLPYWTLLANGINHPDDRGHELMGRTVGAALVVYLQRGNARLSVNLRGLG